MLVLPCRKGKLGKPGEKAHLPPPAMGAKRFPDYPVECGGKVRPGTGRLPKRQVVQTEVDEGTDPHIGNAMGAPEIGTLVIQLAARDTAPNSRENHPR